MREKKINHHNAVPALTSLWPHDYNQRRRSRCHQLATIIFRHIFFLMRFITVSLDLSLRLTDVCNPMRPVVSVVL